MINGFYLVLRQVLVRGIPALVQKLKKTPQQREDQLLKRQEEKLVRKKNRKTPQQREDQLLKRQEEKCIKREENKRRKKKERKWGCLVMLILILLWVLFFVLISSPH
ncbi:unannotated protein [freshwater metagenome]|uniref:Unannotated protein n=1 Tax=freshwater metagenome TaxID=449393 RepID=A0A6J7FF51_9ZZZZ|nr:hypothetical protein [Actinomycetota bacterium]MSX15121.1 hypothetical protein [Actinomycetota bacterium]MSX35715.1 hypothetical protein [Actinomycetota bacterium]MSZ71283.1 hypothetical protein [Actinomycetota bacterium]MUH55529.1 hypothetical protein [Actinomycetota bacterium]